MLYDLNVPWSPTESAELQRTVAFLDELGYDVLALTHELKDNVTAAPLSCAIPKNLPFPTPKRITLLRRLTLHTSDPAKTPRLPTLHPHYDIIAIRPTTEKAFNSACLDLAGFSIISLDLAIRYNFFFKAKPLAVAFARGIKFEICYSQALSGGREQRSNFISNAQAIVRASRGRGLIISSEAKKALGVRAPADIMNLMDIWGLAKDKAVEAVGENARSVVANERMRRTSFVGAVDVVFGGEPPEYVPKPANGGKVKKGKAQADNGTNGGKRKSDVLSEDPPTISKSKAKRMRLEAQKADKEKGSTALGTTTDIPKASRSLTNG